MLMALAAVTALSFAACGSQTQTGGSAQADGSVVYKVGAEPTFPPFDTTDSSGNMVGLDMDIMDRIAEMEGFQVEYVNLGFDALIPSLQSGNIDIIASGMNSLNEERRAVVDFSEPYFDAGLVLAVAEGNDSITGVDDLTPDMKVAAQIGTSSADRVQELKDEDGNLLYPDGRTPAYPLLYAQVTRRFRGFDLYVGGENLTGYRQKCPIVRADDPFSADFDAASVWGPLMGAKIYMGLRITIWK